MRRRSGFTLIELVLALTVVLLLGAAISASVQSAHSSSLAIRSATNIRQLAVANLNYAAEHGTFAPIANRNNTKRWSGGRASDGSFDPALGYLADYLGESRQVTPCPLFTEMVTGGDSFESGAGGYGYNDNYVGGRPEGQSGGRRAWDSDGDRIAARPSQILEPSRTVMFTSSAYATGDSVQEYPFSHPPFWDFGSGPSGMRPSPSVHFRFSGRALAAWCDGHVSFESIESRDVGHNPHGGNADTQMLGWFGPDENNGFWNPENQ
ncbi:MAG: prepilin-type N-terminal cleavage/methylation domain-containing protein [Verrucomicrobiota bacterium]